MTLSCTKHLKLTINVLNVLRETSIYNLCVYHSVTKFYSYRHVTNLIAVDHLEMTFTYNQIVDWYSVLYAHSPLTRQQVYGRVDGRIRSLYPLMPRGWPQKDVWWNYIPTLLLSTQINFNASMKKYSFGIQFVGWNYSRIFKRQRCNYRSLGMDK